MFRFRLHRVGITDKSDDDARFAMNCHIPFYLPEMVFV